MRMGQSTDPIGSVLVGNENDDSGLDLSDLDEDAFQDFGTLRLEEPIMLTGQSHRQIGTIINSNQNDDISDLCNLDEDVF